MKAKKIKEGIYWMGAVDWDRRLFDSLIPLPDGTSYNAYLIQGNEKTVLLDTVDPSMADTLLLQLENIQNIDYVVAHHAEQDHSGTIPYVLEKYKHAKAITTPKGKGMLIDLLGIPEEKFITVDDGETLSIGNKTLEFIHTPWVHWPETMSTYLREDYILFTCDFFGSHLATSDLYVTDEARVYEAAKRYYAEIMMPFRIIIKRNLEKIKDHKIDFIAPSHGPIYDKPKFIIDAYRDWVSDIPKNVAVLPYISMHGSTRKMVEYLVSALAEKGVTVHQFDLAATDIGKLAITLVDAATIVIGTPTVNVGPHPNAFYAAYLANALRPKLKFASIIGSYGWGSKAIEQIAGAISNLKVEILDPVFCKGFPKEADFKALDKLATTIAEKHKEL
jgi:flavorubredoxin